MRVINKNNNNRCPISRTKLTEFFTAIHSQLHEGEYSNTFQTVTERDELTTTEFTQEEVAKRLALSANTAPGGDRISYGHLKQIDPDAKLLTPLLNVIRKSGKVPSEWKQSRTILIHKGGNENDPSN